MTGKRASSLAGRFSPAPAGAPAGVRPVPPRPETVAIIAGQLAIGGAERQLYLWLANLDRARFRPVVVTLHPDCGDYWEDAIAGLDVPLLTVRRRRNPAARLFEIVRLLRPHRPVLVHGWHLFASPYAGAAASLLGARASLGSLRGSSGAYRRLRLHSGLTEWLTDGLLVNSESAAGELGPGSRRFGDRIYTVANAVEDCGTDRAASRAALGHRYGIAQPFWVGSTGRLQASKRFDVLLEVMAGLPRADAALVLAGDGPMRRSLVARAEELGIADRTIFTGEDPDVRRWVNAFDVFCFPSEDEGLPNAVLEAAAAAVPIVAWRSPFLEEILENGRSALLVEPGDVRGFREAVAALLRDSDLCGRMGRAARASVLDRFSVERFVAALTRTYEDLLADGSGSDRRAPASPGDSR